QHDKATTCFEAALARFEKVGDVREQAIAHLHLAETALAQARLADTQARRDVLHISRAHCAEATRRFNRSGYALGLADVDRVYAGLAQLEGRWAVAERYLRDALAVYEEHGDRLNLAETHAELGHLLQAMGQENQAHEALSRSRTEFSSLLGDREDTLN
ncbi:MAG: hypothetical protein H5T69_17955, partial [Chloroflexi bacterium]|nr:hypothetical protein [Chloroflexota bacterium]